MNAKMVVATMIYIAEKAKDLLGFRQLVMEPIIILQAVMTKAKTKSELSFHDHSFIKVSSYYCFVKIIDRHFTNIT